MAQRPTAVSGLIAPGGYGWPDDLIFPDAAQTLDRSGVSVLSTAASNSYHVYYFNNGYSMDAAKAQNSYRALNDGNPFTSATAAPPPPPPRL